MDGMARITVAEVERAVAAALRRAGCDGEKAVAVAGVVAAAERDGCASHGVFRLGGYLAALRSGKVDGAARPAVSLLAPSVLRIDARGGIFLLAIDPARFGDAGGWLGHAEGFLARPSALEGVRLPGDRRAANRRRSDAEGVEIPAKLWAEVLAAAGG